MNNKEARKAIENEDYRSLVGLEVQVDDLEKMLRENGFQKTDRGKDNFMYETVASNPMYSIAVLEAEKNRSNYIFTVEQENGVPLVVGEKVIDNE